ncbi:MAG: HAD family phosphatase [Defluviitaleaceae bacterium]|nr:HAD family phosphatase [Defluviitaleaceae bacterium]
MTSAVIFDMDGVLIDSQPLHYEIDMRVLKACGYPAQLSTVVPYTGVSNPDRWPKYKETLELSQSVEELIEMAEQTMRDVFNAAEIKPIPGIPELLDGISVLGIRCGVASSSSHELIKMVLERTGLAKNFAFIVSGEDVSEGKPSPDIYIKASEKAGLSPKVCIAIEDAPSGIASAKNAGLCCIAYRNPNTLGQEFDRADYVVNKFDECFPIIKTLFFKSMTGSLA